MQDKNKMHPDDQRNLILFGVISILLWLGYDHYILGPKLDNMRVQQELTQKQAIEIQSKEGMVGEPERPRDEVVGESGRVEFENDLIRGTINLKGARVDDLILKEHFDTIEKQDNVVLLSPAGTPDPRYIEHGWVADGQQDVKSPTKQSEWKIVGGDKLTADQSIRLQWNNGEGLTFEQVIALDNAYGFTTVKKVINNTGNDVTLYPYSLILQRGIPKEFQKRWVVHEGPIGYYGDSLHEFTYGKMDKKPKVEEQSTKGWVGLTSKNWLTALTPDQETDTTFRIVYTKGVKLQGRAPIKDRYQTDILGSAVAVPAGQMGEHTARFFAGAKKVDLLNSYADKWNLPHFNLTVDWGWFYFFTKPFFYIINFFYGLVGNFGVAIIMFTVLLRICVFPLANTSFKSFAKMRQIGPQMTELRDKYDDDKQKLQQELVKLYQREKVNPMAGCLPIVIQIPIFFSLFKVLSNTIEMRHAPFFGWIEDLSAPDPTSVFNLFGLLPFTPPSILMIGAWPCLMLITMIIQRKLSPPPADKMQARIIAAMPWVMTFVLAQFAAGLVIYWTFNNLFAVIQQYIIMTRMGVKVDLIGNIFGKKKDDEMEPVEGIHPEAVVAEKQIESAVTGEEKPITVSKPKPKKSKKKK